MDVRVGLWRKLSAEELMLLNCGVGETLESPLDCKVIQPVHPKGDQSWVFIGRTNAKAETPVLWPPHVKSWLIGKDPDAGRDWGHEKKGMTEDEMAGMHHQLDGNEFEWTPGVDDEQGGLVCCDSWGHKELATTERLNCTGLKPVPKAWLVSMRICVWLEGLHHVFPEWDRTFCQDQQLYTLKVTPEIQNTVLLDLWASQVGLVLKNPLANAWGVRDAGSIPVSGRYPEGKATHSSILACRILWREEPGGLQSMGLQRVRHDWSDLACTHWH